MALSRTKKIILFILSFLVAILLVVLIGGPVYLEYKIRTELEKGFSEALNSEVCIADVDIRWMKGEIMLTHLLVYSQTFPKPKVKLSIAEAGIIVNQESGMSLQNLGIDRLYITDCNIFVITDAEGQINWEPSQNEAESYDSIPSVKINEIDITNAGIHIVNHQNKTSYHVNGVCINYDKPNTDPNAYNVYAQVDNIQLNPGTGYYILPRLEWQGSVISDSTGFKSCIGNARINQWFSEFRIEYDKNTGNTDVEWLTPECGFGDIASLFLPINLKADTLKFSGNFSSQLNLKLSKQLGLELLSVNSEFTHARVENKIRSSSGGINGVCYFYYRYSTAGEQVYRNDSLTIFSGNDTLSWYVGNTADDKKRFQANASGSISLNSISRLFELNQLSLFGRIEAEKQTSGEVRLSFDNAGIYNHKTERTLSFDESFVSLSPVETRFGITISEPQHHWFTMDAAMLRSENTTSQLVVNIHIPVLQLGASNGDNSLLGTGYTFPKNSDVQTFIIHYPQQISSVVSLNIDSLSVGGTLITNVNSKFTGNNESLYFGIRAKNDSFNYIDAETGCKRISDNRHKAFIKSDFRLQGTQKDISGNIWASCVLTAETDDSLHFCDNSIHGTVMFHTDSIEVSKKLISGIIPYVQRLISGESLKISKTTLLCQVSYSDFLIEPFDVSIDKWTAHGSGGFNPSDSINISAVLTVDPKQLSFIERSILKDKAEQSGADFDELIQSKKISVLMIVRGLFKHPVTYTKFRKTEN